jgi:hypothetical protein
MRAAPGALLICAAMLPLLSGCTLYNRVFHRSAKTAASCHERPFAGNADSRPPLKVPEGLSAPDTRNAVKIPDLGAADRERPKTEPCLALPPQFFVKAPSGAAKPVTPGAPAPTPATATPPVTTAPPATDTPPTAPAAPQGASSGDVVPPG